MKKLLFIFIALPLLGFGQFTDDFSDGDFTNIPSWTGDVGRFEVDTNSLHLNDSAASTSSLVTQSQAIINGEWIFNVKMDFSPSTNNFAKVYLASDMVNLSGALNGMYVKVGGQSGNIDDISLYTQTGTNSNEIIDGSPGLISNNPDVRIKVTRDAIGNWELFLDTTGVFFTQGTAFDNSILSSDYFGVYCKYTITRSDKFWFDDFSVTGFAASWDCDISTGCYESARGQGQYFSLTDCQIACNMTAINEKNSMIKVEKIIDFIGREITFRRNTPLFYIYDDGTFERRIVIE